MNIYQSLLIRLHDKYGMRTCPGGHIELDETPQHAAIREAKEETGLDITLYDKHQLYHGETPNQKELIPPIFLNIHRIGQTNHQHIGMVYFGYSETDQVVPLHESDASNDRKWMTIAEVENADHIYESIKTYAIAAIRAYN